MKVTTKTGDKGRSGLLFDRRVRKDNLRLHAYGTLDELSSFLGLAKCKVRRKWVKDLIHAIQEDIFILCSELATLPRDLRKLEFRIDRAMVDHIEERLESLERKVKLKECCFLIPGEGETSSLLDICRCVTRRAERYVVTLRQRRAVTNPLVLTYLNRLSDLLYLLARCEEKAHTPFIARTKRRPEKS